MIGRTDADQRGDLAAVVRAHAEDAPARTTDPYVVPRDSRACWTFLHHASAARVQKMPRRNRHGRRINELDHHERPRALRGASDVPGVDLSSFFGADMRRITAWRPACSGSYKPHSSRSGRAELRSLVSLGSLCATAASDGKARTYAYARFLARIRRMRRRRATRLTIPAGPLTFLQGAG